jgi:hypothetical protein
MAKYRKKPIVIEAERYEDWMRVEDKLPEGVVVTYWNKPPAPYEPGDYTTVHTLEGPHLVSDGDYIITGVKGEKYLCKPDTFKVTYEKVEEV